MPSSMASLFVDNGYRTASNGTAWACWSFTADYFGFDEFYTTSNFSTALSYLETDADNDGNSDYYVVVSVGSGLFTTGGHYIVLVAEDNDTLTVYDPYLYSGKFDTASRKAAGVVVSGNNVYVSESSFKTYANYRNFWIFSNDKGSGNFVETTDVNYTRYVSTQSANLNVRSGAGTSYSVIGSLAKGTQVTVTQVKGNWSYISSPINGWVSSSYLSASAVSTTSSSSSSSYTKYVNTSSKNLNVRSGAGTGYSVIGSLAKGTAVTVSRTSGSWSYITSPMTGWVSSSYLSSSTTSSSSSYTTGTYKVTASLLNVRTGPGTGYSKKTYSQLTSNARNQNKALGNYYANGYLKGVVCTVTQVNGNWGKTASGWICLDYCTKQ